MKKRLLSLLLAVAMLAAMFVMPVSAEEIEPARTVTAPSQEYEADVWYEVSTAEHLLAYLTNKTSTNARSLNCEANKGKTLGIRLTADIDTKVNGRSNYYAVFYVGHYSDTASEQFPISLVLDLNGHTITDTSENNRLFGVYSGSKLVITNGTILANGAYAAAGGTILTHGKTDITLDGVRLRSTDETVRTTRGGLYSASTAGARLTVINSELEATAGHVDEGGLLATTAASFITIQNSVLKGGHARRGGSIFASASVVLNMTDTLVLGGTADGDGGNLFAMGTVNMTRCTLTAGTSGGIGGNAYFQAKPAALKDCTVENGFAATAGNNLYINGGPVTFENGTVFGGVYCVGTATFTGAPVISNYDYEGIELTEPAVFDSLQEGTRLVISGQGALSAADVSAYLEAGYILPCTRTALTVTEGVLTGAASDTGYCPHCQQTVAWTPYTADTVQSGHYYAEAMTELTPTAVPAEADMVLDLRGKVETVARFPVTGKLSVISSVSGGGILDRVSETTTNDGPTLRTNGTVNIYGGTFVGTSTTGKGGTLGIYGGGSLSLYSGRVTGGNCTNTGTGTVYTGGNLYVGEKTVFTMYGGLIDNGVTTKNGGNIETYKGTMYIHGGVILGGTASNTGGNINLGTSSTLEISGGIVYGGSSDRGGNLYSGATSGTIRISGGTVDGGMAGTYGGNAFINNGKFYLTGGTVSSGVAALAGGNLYLSAGFYAAGTDGALTKKYSGNICQIGGESNPTVIGGRVTGNDELSFTGYGGNISLFGDLTLGKATICDGSAPLGAGDLFVGKTASTNAPKLTVNSDFDQALDIFFGTSNNTTPATAFNLTAYGEPIFANFTAQAPLNARLSAENMDGTPDLYTDGDGQLTICAGALTDGADTAWYPTVQDAAEACADDQYVKLYAAENTLDIEDSAVADLNGKSLTVTGEGKLYGFDSANDDYDGWGTVTGANAEPVFAAPNGNRYVAVTDEAGTSFHRLGMRISHVSLRPSVAGLYFKGIWQCDSALQAHIASFGVATSAADMPTADFRADSDTLYTTFPAESFASGVTHPGALIANILKEGEDNVRRSVQNIYTAAYVTLDNGQTVIGDDWYRVQGGVPMRMYDVVQGINRNWAALSDTQQTDMKTLYTTFADTLKNWELYNIEASLRGTAVNRPLKILTLGHSLAVDSGHMLNLVAAAEGFRKEMIIGTLYHSGCPLYRHVDNLEGDRIDYHLYVSNSKTPDQPPVILEDVTMKDAIVYDDWDIIVMQGGVWELAEDATFTNGDIQTIQRYVNQHKTNPNAVFAWHTPWAFATEPELQTSYETQTGKTEAENTYKNGYKKFNNDRLAAYEAFQQQVQTHILTDESFVYLIPSGTAFENAMSSYLTEFDLHRDYAHASDLGRVISSYTWYCTLTGITELHEIALDAIPMAFLRSTEDKTADRVLTYAEKAVILEAVNNALKNPVTLTQSRYTEEPVEFIVPQPMSARPDYSVSEAPSTEELRQTAVRAMADMLSIQWSTTKTIDYNKTGAVSDKDYHYDTDTVYCGLPYADGQTNLFVWLEYYDPATGRLKMKGDGQWLNSILGNTCAGSLMWAWSTVCDSLTGSFVNTSMVYKYGCLPVGNYTVKNMTTLNSYYSYGTDLICADNGSDVMYPCYAQMKPADAVTSSTRAHAMMVIAEPVVTYNPDGSIDGANSYVYIQDQAAGVRNNESGFHEITGADGTVYHYTGRTEHKYTFEQLFNYHYIPVTTAEFQGEAYEKATVSFSEEACATVEQLLAGSVTGNYPMSILKLNATDADGNTETVHTVYFNRADVKSNKARSYYFAGDSAVITDALEDLDPGTYTLTAEVTASTGEIFTPVTVTYTR